MSGSGVNTTDGTTSGAIGGLGAHTNGVNALTPVTATQATNGAATLTSAPTVGEVPGFSDITSTAGGTVGNAAATINTSGAITLTPGGANTSVTGQVISEINMQ